MIQDKPVVGLFNLLAKIVEITDLLEEWRIADGVALANVLELEALSSSVTIIVRISGAHHSQISVKGLTNLF